jgi:hypothetical protein
MKLLEKTEFSPLKGNLIEQLKCVSRRSFAVMAIHKIDRPSTSGRADRPLRHNKQVSLNFGAKNFYFWEKL